MQYLDNIPHSLAIIGSSDKAFTLSKKLTQKLLCINNTGCCKCGPCVRTEKEINESVLIIKPENQIIKIESAKEVINFIKLTPINKANVVIIKYANLMNKDASNHLLKVIEEPNKHQYFMLLAPEESTLLSTIKSRVQIIRVNNDETYKNDTLVFKKALRLLEAIVEKDIYILGELKIKDRKEALCICYLIREFLRDLAISQYDKTMVKHPEIAQVYGSITTKRAGLIFDFSSKMIQDIKGNIDRTLLFEHMILMK